MIIKGKRFIGAAVVLLICFVVFLNTQPSKVIDSDSYDLVQKNVKDEGVTGVTGSAVENFVQEPEGTRYLTDENIYHFDIGGESVNFELQSHPAYAVANYTFPETGAELYDELSKRAEEGDIAAARELGQQLGICDQTEKTQESLDAYKKLINQALEYKGPKEYHDGFGSYEQGQAYIQQLERDFSFCQSISQAQIDDRVDFFELAAAEGDLLAARRAQNEYYKKRDFENGVLASLRLWNEFGDIESLLGLSSFMQSTLMPTNISMGDLFNTDLENKVLAHSLFIIGMESRYIMVVDHSPDQVLDFLLEHDTTFSEAQSRLSPSELADAEAYARELLKTNENCCVAN